MIEYLPLVLTGIGIIVAIIYYTLTLRNTNKTRQAQLFMNLYSTYSTPETQGHFRNLFSIDMNSIED